MAAAAAARGQRPIHAWGVLLLAQPVHISSLPPAARDSRTLILSFCPSGPIAGTHPLWAPSFLPPAAPPAPICHHVPQHGNMDRRALLLRELAQGHQAPKTRDSSSFNRWDPQVPQGGAEG